MNALQTWSRGLGSAATDMYAGLSIDNPLLPVDASGNAGSVAPAGTAIPTLPSWLVYALVGGVILIMGMDLTSQRGR